MEPELCEHEVAVSPWQASGLFSNWEYCSSWAGSHCMGLTDLPEAVTILCDGCQVSFSWCCCTCRNAAGELEKRPRGRRNQCSGSPTFLPPRCLLKCPAPCLPIIFSNPLPQLSCTLQSSNSCLHVAKYTGTYLNIS